MGRIEMHPILIAHGDALRTAWKHQHHAEADFLEETRIQPYPKPCAYNQSLDTAVQVFLS